VEYKQELEDFVDDYMGKLVIQKKIEEVKSNTLSDEALHVGSKQRKRCAEHMLPKSEEPYLLSTVVSQNSKGAKQEKSSYNEDRPISINTV